MALYETFVLRTSLSAEKSVNQKNDLHSFFYSLLRSCVDLEALKNSLRNEIKIFNFQVIKFRNNGFMDSV